MPDSNSKLKHRFANLILRFVVFGIYVTLGTVIIVAIEKTNNADETRKKSKLLSDLQVNITKKYNLTIREFESLADAIYDAKSPSPLKWTYFNGLSFVIQLITTIGKLKVDFRPWPDSILSFFAVN